jgi:uracil-DNA glycosylase
MKRETALGKLNQKIIHCKKCPRLASYIRKVAKEKVKRFSDQKYWGKPLAGFGDINAELLLVGLAPAVHGGNRTGRCLPAIVLVIGLQEFFMKMV